MIPTNEEIELLKTGDLIKTYNELAPNAGQNPVKKFETRAIGIKRLTAVAEVLRAREASGGVAILPENTFPLIIRPAPVQADEPTGTEPEDPTGGGDIGQLRQEAADHAALAAVIEKEANPVMPKPARKEKAAAPNGKETSVAKVCRDAINAGLNDVEALAAARAAIDNPKRIPGTAIRYYRARMGGK